MDCTMSPFMCGGMILGWIFILTVLGAAVLAVIWLVWRASGSTNKVDSKPDETPLTILKRRYAQGEIDQTQFEDMKQQLAEQEGR